jgi:imidazolonepropionase-like amidohydrolase
MPKRNKRRPSSSPGSRPSLNLTRRELLAGAGAGAAAIFLKSTGVEAQAPPAGRPIVFTHTIVANPDLTQEDVALAVVGDKIADIGPTDAILQKYPNADQYDGRGKVILPGLINCHGHLGAVLSRGTTRTSVFPTATSWPSSRPACSSPASPR